MDQPYSFLADWLSKFHMASEPIQALWIVALSATVLGVTGIVMRGVREIVGCWLGRGVGRGALTDAVYQDERGRSFLGSSGRTATDVEWRDPAGTLIGRGREFG